MKSETHRIWKLLKSGIKQPEELILSESDELAKWNFTKEYALMISYQNLVNSGMEETVKEIRACERCPLYENATQKVVGKGSKDPDVLFIGEAPGQKEDEQGKPFVGAAGKQLNKMIGYLGIENYAVINAVKCRPPKNRKPTQQEIERCYPFMKAQIELLDPKVIILLGNTAEEAFTPQKMERGKPERFNGGRWVVKVFHPAALIYEKTRVEEQKQYMSRIKGVLE